MSGTAFEIARPSEACKRRLTQLREFRLLFGVPEFSSYLAAPKTLPAFRVALSKWSSDLLVAAILQVEQIYLPACDQDEVMHRLVDVLKTVYLEKVGVAGAGEIKKTEADILFRGLLTLKDDLPVLMKKTSKLHYRGSAIEYLAVVYGAASIVDEVVVVGSHAIPKKEIVDYLNKICSAKKHCQFWDRRFLNRVVITHEDGIAAYLPETAILVLSDSLLSARNLLNRVVLMHELAHVAEKRSLAIADSDWVATFSAFSGWAKDSEGKWRVKVEKGTDERNDPLTVLSKGSAFSILPDPIYWVPAEKGQPRDGFVMAKTYRESLERNDPSEDLADHLAIYRFLPARFCVGPKPLAPRKYKWIAETVFGEPGELACPYPPGRSQP